MAQSSSMSQTARSTPLHVAVAFVAMGGWAALANSAHGPRAMLPAFLVQGALSAVLMLLLKRGLEALYARLPGPAARIAPPLISCTLIAGVLTAVHALAGTPEILKTVALPWTASTLYAFVYTATLPAKESR